MRRALLLISALVFLIACSSEEFVDRATLLRDPAAKLRFLEAVELAHVGGERENTFEGAQGAFDGYILGTQASESAVHDYYARELERMGWYPDRLVGLRSTAELVTWGWCKGRINYRLGIKDQRSAFRPEFYKGQTFATVFDARLGSRRLSRPCPDVSPAQ